MTATWLCGIALLMSPAAQDANSPGSMPEGMVAAHNLYRAKVGSPPLTWSDKLADGAHQWAATLIESGAFTPRHDSRVGQNLYEIRGGNADPAQVVSAWAAEAANYHADTNSCTARCGHYTQVVWRDTRRVGCGVARNAHREVWACDYGPPGNIVGERPF